ncbi:MAG: hypothetical protein OXH07_07325 [Chloroflexi bacterium]|nr:hypothetical protein [Chloroflexota bacterium]
MPSSGLVLEPGHVYRTRDLSQWTSNPARLARRLVERGQFKPLAQGLFVHPRKSRFGAVPPADEEVMRAFLDGPFVLTGPERWNALGLGTSAAFAAQLVYNTKRSGEFTFGGRRFLLRRVAFPEHPSPEWFVVDLFQHAEQAAADRDDLTTALDSAVRSRRFDPELLRSMAREYGSLDTQARVASALGAA